MQISLHSPAGLYRIGKRANNQDAIYPALGEASGKDRLFVVCDGVGGANHGEVASRLLTEMIPFYFDQDPPEGQNRQTWLTNLLGKLEADFTRFFKEECPQCNGMSSTLCLLWLDEKGAMIGWVGDSRVYHFREGSINFVTKDHSLVQQWVHDGIIDEERARVHPKRNIILRSVMSATRPTRIEGHEITDLQTGDYFFLCTDGMLEVWTDEKLQELFATGQDPKTLMDAIYRQCEGNTHDNFSGYIIQIAGIE